MLSYRNNFLTKHNNPASTSAFQQAKPGYILFIDCYISFYLFITAQKSHLSRVWSAPIMGRTGFCVVAVLVIVTSFMISGAWSYNRGWTGRKRASGGRNLQFIDDRDRQEDDRLDELRRRLDFADRHFFHPNRQNEDSGETRSKLAFLGPNRIQPIRETSKKRPCDVTLGENCGPDDDISFVDQLHYLNSIQSRESAGRGLSKKRSCNVNLGGNCATEDAASVTDQWHYLNSPQSPGRRRKRGTNTGLGLLAARLRLRR